MNQIQNLHKLQNLSYFDKETLAQVIDLSDNSLYGNIKRWLKKGSLIQLKKGLYVTREYVNFLPAKDFYAEFIANKLKEPSYLSLEYVLQKHSIVSEAVYALTSVTLKSKRLYQNRLGSFIYRQMKEDLFRGFEIKKKERFEIKEASLAKALFDYLYFQTMRAGVVDRELLESYRLNLEGFSDRDLEEFADYCERAKITQWKLLPPLIEEIRDT